MRILHAVLVAVMASGSAGLLAPAGADAYREWQKNRLRSEARSNLFGLFTSMKTYSGEF